MSRFGKIAVLLGGQSAEREVSLMSGRNVLDALRGAGMNAHAFDPKTREIFDLKRENFDCVFIALHGRYGEDGTIQGALDLMRIPYTGSGVLGSALAMDKERTKQIWSAVGIPTPRFEMVDAATDWAGVVTRIGLPLIIKPVREGSSIGLTRVLRADDLPQAYALAARHDTMVMAEEFVPGQELTGGFLGNDALPLVRIEAPQGNYDYQNKYFSDKTRYFCPCGLTEGEERLIRELVLRSAHALDCSGWGRADLIRRPEGGVQFLEMNTSPGMTAHSLVPMAAKQAGLTFPALVMRILELAHVE